MAARLTAFIVMGIVTVTFVAGLIVGAHRDDASGPVDLIVLNGKVYLGRVAGRFGEAVAVRGNQILRVGTNREIRRLRRPQTVVVDAHGGTVLAGFNDAHVHLARGALWLGQVDVTSAATADAIQQGVRAYAAANPARPWIVGRAPRSGSVPGGVPLRQVLDAAVPDRPVLLTSLDGRSGWLNSKALALAGITKRARSPHDGAVVRDPGTGEPTGEVRDEALASVRTALPAPTRAEKVTALRAAVAEANRVGVTSVQTVSDDPEDFALLHEIRQEGDLSLRVYGAFQVSPEVTEDDLARLDRVRGMFPDDPTLRIGALDVVCRDEDPASEEDPVCRPEELGRAVERFDRHQWQVVVRAAGEGDVRAGIEAFARAAAVNAAPGRGRRHRIEDAEPVEPDGSPRGPTVGIVAGPPENDVLRLLSPPAEGLAESGGPRSAVWSAFGGATGVRLMLGSDWPRAPFDPRAGLEQAISLEAAAAGPAEDVPRRPGLPLAAAIDAYTQHPSYASYDELRKGTLAPGMLADIVIFSGDMFESAPERVKDSVVDVTIFDGRVVYQRLTPAADHQD